MSFSMKVGGRLAAIPGVEAVPQKENTVRMAVRFPCGCMQTVDIPLARLDDLAGPLDVKLYLGEKAVDILTRLTKDAEVTHNGTDPKSAG